MKFWVNIDIGIGIDIDIDIDIYIYRYRYKFATFNGITRTLRVLSKANTYIGTCERCNNDLDCWPILFVLLHTYYNL